MSYKYLLIAKSSVLFRSVAQSLIAFGFAHACAWGQVEPSNTKTSVWNLETGFDSWVLSPSAQQDTLPDYIEDNANLLLVNSHTAWQYKNQSPYLRLMGEANLTQHLTFSVRARADQQVGTRVDALQVQYEISPQMGLRAGVAEYKTSWCKSYDTDSAWIQEIDAPCSTELFEDVTGGAPGAQIYTRQTWGDYFVQTQLGLYRPQWLGYDPQEFGFAVPSKQFQVQGNDKWGVSLNALNLEQGTEFRAAYIHAKQKAYSPEPNIQGRTHQSYGLIYLAAEVAVNSSTKLRLTHTRQDLHQTCLSSVALLGQCNWNTHMLARSNSFELSHQLDSKNIVAFAVSAFDMQLEEVFFNPTFDLSVDYPNGLGIHNRRHAIAWRHEWTPHIFSAVQWIGAKADSVNFDTHVPSNAKAMGFRLAYRY